MISRHLQRHGAQCSLFNSRLAIVEHFRNSNVTSKLSYRKDDRAMRPIYGCNENFRESLCTPTATFAEIFNGISLRSILWMCVQNFKFVALPIPEIIGGTQKNVSSSWIRQRSLFSEIFHGLWFGWTLSMYRPNLQSAALHFPEIIAIAVLGWVVNTQSWEGEAVGGRGWFERAFVSSYRPSIVTFRLSLLVSEILPLLCSSTPLFPYPTSSIPKISPSSPRIRCMAFGLYKERSYWAKYKSVHAIIAN